MVKCYIGIGSNLCDKAKNIYTSLELLREKITVLNASSLYKTEPVGYKDQDWFLNCVIEAETELSPEDLLLFLQSVEMKLKRVKTIRYGPRIIDMDILFYGDLAFSKKDLIIPHPRLHERAFVLVPLNEINPHLVHPLFKKTISQLLKEVDKKGVELFKPKSACA